MTLDRVGRGLVAAGSCNGVGWLESRRAYVGTVGSWGAGGDGPGL